MGDTVGPCEGTPVMITVGNNVGDFVGGIDGTTVGHGVDFTLGRDVG